MKQRFSSLDVKVIALELSLALVSLRLANVYDLSSRIFLFKFAKPDQRKQVVVESGFRCHLTNFTRATAATPSPFVSRLRKFLRTRRVTAVLQLGTDRIIEFQFSDGQYRLFLEFYAGGNIILTDKELTEELRVGLKYSLSNKQNYDGAPALTKESVRRAVQLSARRGDENTATPSKKSVKRPSDILRKALASSFSDLPPVLIDHALRKQEFDPNTPLDDILNDQSLLDRLLVVLGEARNIIDQITTAPLLYGYIIAKTKNPTAARPATEPLARSDLVYDDYHPFKPAQLEEIAETHVVEIEGFNNTVDEFYSSIESQKLESRLTEREEHAKKKLDAARQDHEKRIGSLQQVQELNVRKAKAIEANLQKVQEAMAALNGLIGQGMDWEEIARLIEMEQARHNAVAEMIKLPLKLYENTATLLLTEARYMDEEDFEGNETGSDVSTSEGEQFPAMETAESARKGKGTLPVDVDLAISPWSNARQYYDQKRSAAVKEQRTLQASTKALKSTERKVNADLQKGLKQEKEVMRPVRKQFWFEKFLYFISSEGYLVLGGRDAQQNENLYRKHLGKGDLYVHADLEGAASIIVKNKPGMLDKPIPPSTLSQAGSLAVSTSSAWDSKAVMSAWWVKADQISKTAPTGEYLTTGGFTIRGQKNYLPPAQLLLGFGIIFRVSEESKARHLKHRVIEDSEPQESNFAGTEGAMESQGDSTAELHDVDTCGNLDRKKKAGSETGESIEGEDVEKLEQSEEDLDGATNALHTEALPAGVGEQPTNGEGRDLLYNRPNPLQPNLHHQYQDETNTDVDYRKESTTAKDSAGYRQLFPPMRTSSHAKDMRNYEQGSVFPIHGGEATSYLRHLTAGEGQIPCQNQAGARTELKDTTESHVLHPEHATNPYDSLAGVHVKSAASPSIQSQHRQVRGKHGKRMKLKAKYADQDKDDRALALRILGSAAREQKDADDAAAKEAKEQEIAFQKERRRRQHATAAQKGEEAEQIRRLNLAEGAETLDDNELESLGDLDNFIGKPLPGDEILDALVMCAPWDAIGGRCRWRAKLQPGSIKKGKAVREILSIWTANINRREKKKTPRKATEHDQQSHDEAVEDREAELVKAFREQEVIGVVPVSKCRVVMGSGDLSKNGGTGSRDAGRGKRRGKKQN